jgi:hypothetical protein
MGGEGGRVGGLKLENRRGAILACEVEFEALAAQITLLEGLLGS